MTDAVVRLRLTMCSVCLCLPFYQQPCFLMRLDVSIQFEFRRSGSQLLVDQALSVLQHF
jgi:hypothetical protein